MTQIRWSIIIPAFNEQENLDKCLRSVSLLDYDREFLEVLVIDNGSEDETIAVAQSYAGILNPLSAAVL